jgi:hypothetical protein
MEWPLVSTNPIKNGRPESAGKTTIGGAGEKRMFTLAKMVPIFLIGVDGRN